MWKVFSKGAVFKLAIGDLLLETVKVKQMWPVSLIYSGLSTSLRSEESSHVSKPLLPSGPYGAGSLRPSLGGSPGLMRIGAFSWSGKRISLELGLSYNLYRR